MSGETFQSCKVALNNQMYGDFFNDYSTLKTKDVVLKDRSYHWILDRNVIWENKYLNDQWKNLHASDSEVFPDAISQLKSDLLADMYGHLNIPSNHDSISELFGSLENDNENLVRYMKMVNTVIRGKIVGMYIVDGICNLFTNETGSEVLWY